MLGLFRSRPKATNEQIRQDRDKWLQEMLDASVSLKHLIREDNKGWKELCELLNDYIDKAKQRKTITALDRATDADIYELKLLDHEVGILSWVMKIPEQFIRNVESEIKKNG